MAEINKIRHADKKWFSSIFGSSDDKFYKKVRKAYHHMKQRCYNPNDKAYKFYGNKGVTVCDRWLEPNGKGFENFATDMGVPENLSMSIDRIDVYGNYEPNNCRWATKKTQMINTTRNVYSVFNGEKMTLTDIAREVGINHQTIFQRIHGYGWSIEKAINTPVRKRG